MDRRKPLQRKDLRRRGRGIFRAKKVSPWLTYYRKRSG